MKTLLLLCALLLAAITANGQQPTASQPATNQQTTNEQPAKERISRFSWSTTAGAGFAVSSPASTPFLWRLSGWYNVSRRFSAGIGTGISCYEKTLVPLVADLRFLLTRPRKFTPFLQCGAGYAFAVSSGANGGLHLSPSIGVQWAIRSRARLLLSIGYEFQKLERLKAAHNEWFSAGFAERLTHNSITVQAGVMF